MGNIIAGFLLILLLVVVFVLQYVMTIKNLSQEKIGKINRMVLPFVIIVAGSLSYILF